MLANVKRSRICVFGAGAIGGHLAANLAAMRANGVALREGAQADARTIAGRVRASDRAAELGAAVYSSNDMSQPGIVVNHTPGRDMLVVGEIDDRPSARIGELRALLGAAGMHSPQAADIRQSVWDKLLLNFGSSLCVPLGEPVSALETVHALIARMAARKGLYSSP